MASISPIDQDLFSKKWYCCCGCMHVKTASMLIGFIKLLFLAPITEKIQELKFHSETISSDVAVVGFLAAVLLFTGLSQEKSGFIVLHLVYQMITLIAFASGLVFSVIIAALIHTGKVEVKEGTIVDKGKKHHMIHAGLMLFGLAIEIWFLVVVYKCYLCFRLREIREKLALRLLVEEHMEEDQSAKGKICQA